MRNTYVYEVLTDKDEFVGIFDKITPKFKKHIEKEWWSINKRKVITDVDEFLKTLNEEEKVTDLKKYFKTKIEKIKKSNLKNI